MGRTASSPDTSPVTSVGTLPAYDIVDELDADPDGAAWGARPQPGELCRCRQGVQIELPPRVRGSSPLWWDWQGDLVPHTRSLIDGLVTAITTWQLAA